MAREAVIRLDVKAGEARAELEKTGRSLSELEVEAVEAGGGFERLSTSVVQESAEARTQINRMRDSMQSMSSASGTATNLTFELTNQLQDMQAAGIRGAANAMPLLLEQFQRLQQQSGSTGGAVNKLLSAFTSPTGVLALGTLALQTLPGLLEFFNKTEEAAEETEQAFSDLSEAITDFGQFEVAGVQIGPQDVAPAIRQLREERRRIQLRLQGLRGQLEDAQERFGSGAAAQRQFQRQTADIRAQIQQLKQRDQQASNFIDKLEEQRQTYQQQLDLRRLLTDNTNLAVDEQGTLTSETSSTADQLERAASAMNALTVDQADFARNMREVQRFFRQGGMQDQLLPQPSQLGGRFGLGQAPTVGGTMLQNTQDRAGQARKALGAAQASGLVDQFRTFDQLMDDVGESYDENVNQQLVQGIQLAGQLGATLVQSAKQGSASFQQIFGSVLQTVGSVVGVANPAIGAGIAGTGTIVKQLQHGGQVHGPGTATSDSIPVRLSDGEFVVNAGSAQRAPRLLQAVNESPSLAARMNTLFTREARPKRAALPSKRASEAVASEQLARITAAVQENTRRLEEATRKGLTLDPYEVAGQIDTIKAEKEAFSTT
jgi:hypothetical protein